MIFGLIVLFFVGTRVYQIIQEQDWTQIEFHLNAPFFFIISAGLVFLNWSFEALKWQRLMEGLKPLSFKEAIRDVLAGLATGLVTPNRAGNFLGRIARLDKELRLKGILRTFYANLAQFSITLIFGLFGLFFLSASLVESGFILVLIGTLIGVSVSIVLIVRPKYVLMRPFSWIIPESVKDGITELSNFSSRLKRNLMGLGTMRYFVFVSQYVLILIALNQVMDILILFGAVAVMYLIMTLIPSLFMGKLFVREAAGLIVFSSIGIPDNVTILAGFLVWLINIALPALVGAGLLVKK